MFNLSFFNYPTQTHKVTTETIGTKPSPHAIGYAIYNGIRKIQKLSYYQLFSLYRNLPSTYHLAPILPSKEITLTHNKLINFEKEYREILSSHDQVLEKATKLFKVIHKHIDDVELQQWMVAEILAKVIAKIPLKKGQFISIPIINADKQSKMVTYEVDTCFDLGQGIPAYGLKPQSTFGFYLDGYWPSFGSHPKENSAPPLLLFRGTDFSVETDSAKTSIAINFDPKGPGFSFFLKANDSIEKWLQKVTSPTQKARVFGYSQGGAFSLYTTIYHPELISQKPHEPSMIFNSPGVNKDLLQRWLAIPSEQIPRLCVLFPCADVVPQFGFLVGNVFQFNSKSPMELKNAHFPLMLLQPSYSLDLIDTEKENLSLRRHYFTNFQNGLDIKVQKAVKESLDELAKRHYPSNINEKTVIAC